MAYKKVISATAKQGTAAMTNLFPERTGFKSEPDPQVHKKTQKKTLKL